MHINERRFIASEKSTTTKTQVYSDSKKWKITSYCPFKWNTSVCVTAGVAVFIQKIYQPWSKVFLFIHFYRRYHWRCFSLHFMIFFYTRHTVCHFFKFIFILIICDLGKQITFRILSQLGSLGFYICRIAEIVSLFNYLN